MVVATAVQVSTRWAAQVAQARRDWFEQSVGGAVTSGALSRFHSETPRGASAYTVRMCRPDAQTMSRSRVRVDGEKVEWSYLEEPGDLAGEPRVVRVEMER